MTVRRGSTVLLKKRTEEEKTGVLCNLELKILYITYVGLITTDLPSVKVMGCRERGLSGPKTSLR